MQKKCSFVLSYDVPLDKAWRICFRTYSTERQKTKDRKTERRRGRKTERQKHRNTERLEEYAFKRWFTNLQYIDWFSKLLLLCELVHLWKNLNCPFCEFIEFKLLNYVRFKFAMVSCLFWGFSNLVLFFTVI